MMAAATRTSKKRRRRSAARSKGRGGVRIKAPNLVEAYRLAGLATGSASDEAWQQAHGAVAEAISTAKQALSTLDATEVDADLDRLLELLAQQRNEARRRFAEEFKRWPGSTDAVRAQQAVGALDAALTRAVALREQQTRRERDATKRSRKRSRKPPDKADGAASSNPGSSLPPNLGRVGRRAGAALQRGVHSAPEFDPSKDIAAQAHTATREQLSASRDALRGALHDPEREHSEEADAVLAAVDARITDELSKKEAAERGADDYARRHYAVTADQLRERDDLPEERFGRNACDPQAAHREVDNVVEHQNASPGPQPQVRQQTRLGPVAVPAPARVGRPPDRGSGVGPRSSHERIAAQSERARQVQDLRRIRQAA